VIDNVLPLRFSDTLTADWIGKVKRSYILTKCRMLIHNKD